MLYGGCTSGLNQFSSMSLCSSGMVSGLLVYSPVANTYTSVVPSLTPASAALMASFGTVALPPPSFGPMVVTVGSKIFFWGGFPQLSAADFSAPLPYHKMAMSTLVRCAESVAVCGNRIHHVSGVALADAGTDDAGLGNKGAGIAAGV